MHFIIACAVVAIHISSPQLRARPMAAGRPRPHLGLPRAAAPRAAAPDELESQLRASLTKRDHHVLFGPPTTLLEDGDDPMFVLLFNPALPNEGVYTLQGQANDKRTYLVVFEGEENARRFSEQLHADEFDLACPTEWDVDDIRAFCANAEFDLAYVPDGALLFPPASNCWDTAAFSDCDVSGRQPSDVDALRAELERLWGRSEEI